MNTLKRKLRELTHRVSRAPRSSSVPSSATSSKSEDKPKMDPVKWPDVVVRDIMDFVPVPDVNVMEDVDKIFQSVKQCMCNSKKSLRLYIGERDPKAVRSELGLMQFFGIEDFDVVYKATVTVVNRFTKSRDTNITSAFDFSAYPNVNRLAIISDRLSYSDLDSLLGHWKDLTHLKLILYRPLGRRNNTTTQNEWSMIWSRINALATQLKHLSLFVDGKDITPPWMQGNLYLDPVNRPVHTKVSIPCGNDPLMPGLCEFHFAINPELNEEEQNDNLLYLLTQLKDDKIEKIGLHGVTIGQLEVFKMLAIDRPMLMNKITNLHITMKKPRHSGSVIYEDDYGNRGVLKLLRFVCYNMSGITRLAIESDPVSDSIWSKMLTLLEQLTQLHTLKLSSITGSVVEKSYAFQNVTRPHPNLTQETFNMEKSMAVILPTLPSVKVFHLELYEVNPRNVLVTFTHTFPALERVIIEPVFLYTREVQRWYRRWYSLGFKPGRDLSYIKFQENSVYKPPMPKEKNNNKLVKLQKYKVDPFKSENIILQNEDTVLQRTISNRRGFNLLISYQFATREVYDFPQLIQK